MSLFISQAAVGILFIAAASLKTYGSDFLPSEGLEWFALPWAQIGVAEWELVLGLWLLSGSYSRYSCLAAILTLAAFAAVSFYLGLLGAATCGCLGRLQVDPWWMFAVDTLAITFLVAPRKWGEKNVPVSQEKGRFFGIVVVSLLLGTATIGSALFFGSPDVAIARLRGESLTISPGKIYIGSGQIGKSLESHVEIYNWGDQPVRIVGATSDCSCIMTSDLPMSIPPGESRLLSVRLKIPNSTPGVLTRSVEVLTDHPRQRSIDFIVICRVVE